MGNNLFANLCRKLIHPENISIFARAIISYSFMFLFLWKYLCKKKYYAILIYIYLSKSVCINYGEFTEVVC